MKDYFLEVVKDGVRIDVAAVKANNQEQANAVVTKAAIGRGLVNISVREVTQEDFDAFRAAQQPAAPAAAEPEQKPKATVSINGGPKIDAESPEAIEALSKAAAELGENPESVVVSFDVGPELPINSLAAEEAFNALAEGVDHSIVITAKPPVNDEPPASEEGNADSAQSDAAENTGEATPPAEGTEEKAPAEGTETAAAA